MPQYCRASLAIALRSLITVIVPLGFLLVFMILMWAGSFQLTTAPLIANTISCSILLGRGTFLSYHNIRRLSAMVHAAIGVGPTLRLTGPL
jgi:uncharacterized membrane protein